jgi:hypothetical protein
MENAAQLVLSFTMPEEGDLSRLSIPNLAEKLEE